MKLRLLGRWFWHLTLRQIFIIYAIMLALALLLGFWEGGRK